MLKDAVFSSQACMIPLNIPTILIGIIAITCNFDNVAEWIGSEIQLDHNSFSNNVRNHDKIIGLN